MFANWLLAKRLVSHWAPSFVMFGKWAKWYPDNMPPMWKHQNYFNEKKLSSFLFIFKHQKEACHMQKWRPILFFRFSSSILTVKSQKIFLLVGLRWNVIEGRRKGESRFWVVSLYLAHLGDLNHNAGFEHFLLCLLRKYNENALIMLNAFGSLNFLQKC